MEAIKNFIEKLIQTEETAHTEYRKEDNMYVYNQSVDYLDSFTHLISDDFSGIKSYNGYINDKWVLFEYESKLKRLTHVFDDALL